MLPLRPTPVGAGRPAQRDFVVTASLDRVPRVRDVRQLRESIRIHF
jgi:hypothetical protein